jgi:uncharacterized protein Smg (DUF494 family)
MKMNPEDAESYVKYFVERYLPRNSDKNQSDPDIKPFVEVLDFDLDKINKALLKMRVLKCSFNN